MHYSKNSATASTLHLCLSERAFVAKLKEIGYACGNMH